MSQEEAARAKRLQRTHLNHRNDKSLALARLKDTGANYVPGRGSIEPAFVIIGEAPGVAENYRRRPFCGRSGMLLDEMLASVGMDRDQVYITNVVKYRPPNNRDPFPNEKAVSLPHLWRELRAVGCPRVVTLGRHAMQAFLGKRTMGEVRGRWQASLPDAGYQCQVLPLYHPAVGLYRSSMRALMFEEFQEVLNAF